MKMNKFTARRYGDMKTTTFKTKAMSILLALVMLFSMLTLTAFAANITPSEPTLTTDQYDLNDDTQMDEVYEIGTAAELYWFAAEVNGGNTAVNAVLTADIVVNNDVLGEDGGLNGDGTGFTPWIPIGTDANSYSGCFDGKGHTVSGLYYNEAETNYAGLFGYAQGAVVRNVGVTDSYIYGKNSMGGIFGGARLCVVSDCYNMAAVGGSRYIGGIAGSAVGTQVTNCYNTGTITGGEYVGGVFGFLSVLFTEDKTLTVSDCFNVGAVTASDDTVETVGSIAGSRAANEENPLVTKNCYGIGDQGLFGVSTVAEQLAFMSQENCENKTAEQFADGTVLQLLNGTQEPAPWIQETGTDSYPRLRKNHPHNYKMQQGSDEEKYWYECLCGEKAYDVRVGGVQVTEANKGDVFGDGKVSYDPETATLTLNGWSYEGDGYEYGGSSDGAKTYSAVIFSNGDLIVRSEGENTLRNTFTDEAAQRYGDGIVAKNSLTLVGDGKLTIFGAFGLSSNGDVIVDDTALELTAQDGIISFNAIVQNGAVVTIDAEDEGIVADDGGDAIIKDGAVVTICSEDAGIVAFEGDAIVESGATLTIRAVRDGIYARQNVTITDSIVDIETEEYGIYAYDGSVTVGSTKTCLLANVPCLNGTKVSIKTGKLAIFAYAGLTVDEKLTISSPEGGQIGEEFVEYEEGDFTYETVMVGEESAKDVVIEAPGCTVTFSELSCDMEVLAPVGQLLNEVCREMYGAEDFAEIIDIEKSYNKPSDSQPTGDSKPAESSQTEDDKPSGSPSTGNNNPADFPQTGDNNNMALWLLLLLSGSAAIAVTVFDKKRKNAA